MAHEEYCNQILNAGGYNLLSDMGSKDGPLDESSKIIEEIYQDETAENARKVLFDKSNKLKSNPNPEKGVENPCVAVILKIRKLIYDTFRMSLAIGNKDATKQFLDILSRLGDADLLYFVDKQGKCKDVEGRFNFSPELQTELVNLQNHPLFGLLAHAKSLTAKTQNIVTTHSNEFFFKESILSGNISNPDVICKWLKGSSDAPKQRRYYFVLMAPDECFMPSEVKKVIENDRVFKLLFRARTEMNARETVFFTTNNKATESLISSGLPLSDRIKRKIAKKSPSLPSSLDAK